MLGLITELGKWNSSISIVLWFFLFSFFVFIFANKMVKYSSLLIQNTRLNAAFVGLVLISIVTSIPELSIQIIQGALGEPSVSVSNTLGANGFSIFFLAIAILFFGKQIISKKIDKLTIINVFLSFFMTVFLTFVLYFQFDINLPILKNINLGLVSLIFLIIYILNTILLYKFRHINQNETEPYNKKTNLKLWQIILGFIIFSIGLILVSIILNFVVHIMIIKFTIDPKSIGGLLLAIVTTLPEMIALLGLIKKGYFIAGIGSIIGSHILNLACLFWGDLAFNNENITILSDVKNIWKIGLLVSVELFLFISFIFSVKYIKNKRFKYVFFIFIIAILLVYVIGWLLLILFL